MADFMGFAGARVTHINNDVLRFWNDGSLLLGASDMTGRLWSGVLRRFADADDAIASKPAEETNTDIGDTKEVDKQAMPTSSATLESGMNDAIAMPFDDGATLSRAVVGYDSGNIEMLELFVDETGQSDPMFVTSAQMNEHDDTVSSIALTCEHKKVVSSSYDKSIKIWSPDKWAMSATYGAHSQQVLMVSCHPEDCEVFASCSQDQSVLLWDTRQPRPASLIQKPSGIVPSALAWQPSAEGTKLVIGNEIGEVVLKDVRKADENLNQIRPLERDITRLEFDPSRPNKLAVCANETRFVVLHLEENIFSITYQNDDHTDFVRGIAWHPKTRKLFTCSWDGSVTCHDDEPRVNLNGPR